MSAPQTQREPSGDLCGVRDHGHRRLRCGGLSVAILDVPADNGNVELAICQLHWDELHAADDPIQLARRWVA
jgi:hypothetical protein